MPAGQSDENKPSCVRLIKNQPAQESQGQPTTAGPLIQESLSPMPGNHYALTRTQPHP